MSRFKFKTFPLLLATILALASVAAFTAHSMKTAEPVYAQTMIPDQTFGFSGSVAASTNAVVVSATTLSARIGGPPAINGVTTSARIHVKHISVGSTASGVVSFFEHPTSGSDILIFNASVLADVPTEVSSGPTQGLGANGYLTGVGSSIRVQFNNTTAATVTDTITASLE